MKAYKVFNKDWSCNGYSFSTKSGKFSKKVFTQEGDLELCSNGFHFCRKLVNCFDYYSFDPNNKVAEIEIIGDYIGEKDDKECTSRFKIIRELSWHEVLELCNSGDCNSGHSNSGDWNSGDCNSGHSNSGDRNSGDSNSGDWNSGHWNSGDSNSGHRNSGHRNSGDWNSGHWNSGDSNSGHCNTNEYEEVRIFNKFTKRKDISFPSFFYFELTKFVSHDTATDEEKKQYKQEIETCGGFLKTLSYKEAWKLSYEKASQEDRDKVKDIPNFDKDLFYEISGIMIEY